MPNLDPRWLIRAALLVAALLALNACGQADGDGARLDKIEHRLDALEQPLAARAGPAVAPSPAPSQTSPVVGAPTASGNDASFAPGAVAIAHAAPASGRPLDEPPTDSVGGFVYIGGPLSLHDLSGRGVRYTGLTGVELQGWLKATEAGRYQLGVDVHGFAGFLAGANCLLEVWMEDRVIGSQHGVLPTPDNSGAEQRLSLVTGANLQPGLYKLRLWTVCTSAMPRTARITVDLLLKAPSDLNLRGFRSEELLHQR